MPGGLPEIVQPVGADTARYIAEYRAALAVTKELSAANRDLVKSVAEVQAALGSLGDKRVRISVESAGALAEIAKVKAALDSLGDRNISIGGDNGAMVRELRDISASMDMATSSMGRMEDHLAVISRNVQDSSADLMMQTQILRDNADAHNAAAAAAAGFAAASAAAGRGGGGGGGGGGGAAAAAAAGGLGGLIFGGAKATLVGAHMATMLTMEIASQVVPAAVAAGAAAAVGYQGGVAAYQRGQGIYAAGEALGGAYGVTPGQLFGMGAGYQIAQNQATGGVYGIIGSIMRMAGQGTGAGGILGPGGMGVQTIAMIDRGLANMVSSGRMAQISGAVGGGTGALQTIGDIFGNLGDTLLNLAPVLPGMGGVLFGGLQAGTGALRSITGLAGGGGLWPLLFGTGMAAEAGFRWGGPILAGGKLPWFLGGAKFGGLAGLAERLGLGATGAAAGTEASGLAGALAGGLGGLSTAGIASLLAASIYGFSQGTFGTPAAGQMGAYMRSINASFGATSLTPISHALFQAGAQQANVPGVSYDTIAGQQVPVGFGIAELRREGYTPQQALATIQRQYAANTQNVANQLGQMTAAGPQAVKALNDLGAKGATLGQAFDYLTMAMISPKDIGPGGKLDPTALSQLASFVKTYNLMGAGGQTSASAILSAAGANYIMATPQVKALSQVNQTLDSMTQVMTGGPANAAALFGVSAGAPSAVAQAMATAPGGRLTTAQVNQIAATLAGDPAAARRLMAGALGQGPFTTAGAAAWTQFAGPQGIIAASQQNMDQLRTFMTMGGLSGAQAGQLGAFELQRFVAPYAGQSPMALAMLQQQAMQAGVPGVAMGQSYAQTMRAINAHAGTMQQANQLMTQGTVAVANIPGVANFLNPNANISPLQSALYAQMAQQSLALAGHPGAAALKPLMGTLTAAGVKPGQMQVSVDAILKNLHVPPGAIAQVNAAISGAMKPVTVPVKANTTQAAGEIHNIQSQKIQDKNFSITGHLHVPPVPKFPDVNFNIVGHLIMPGGVPGTPARVTPLLMRQAGGLVPGSGSGDIIPAMLEPGEAIIPRYLVPMIAPFLAAHRVPGFGAPMGSSSHFAAGGLMPAGGGTDSLKPWMSIFRQAISNSGEMKGFAVQLISELTSALSSVKAHNLAQALVNKIGQEVAYAKNVSSAAMAGQGFGTTGLLNTFDPASMTVAQQMQNYLTSVTSFTSDLSALRKGHLNKALLGQLIAAGPVTGDLLAQSILQSGTAGPASSIAQVNSLWAQIGGASKGLGAQAAMSQFGGRLAPNLTSGQFTSNNVTINIQAGGGATLALTDKQIKQLVAEIQAKLLEQAKRNPRTGLLLTARGI